MASKRVILIGLAVALLSAGCASLGTYDYSGAPYPSYVDESIFYAQLDPYGSWVAVPPYGQCWVPDDVAWGWRPYSDGYWAYTADGWTWMSDEPWGWATYHYGRWLEDPEFGYVWVPGNQWAPAWVAWRYSDNWIGWAALPPDADWNGDGLSGYDDSSLPPDQWCFVHTRNFLSPQMRTSLAPSVRNQALLAKTEDVTRFDVREGRPVNRGVEVATVERLAGRRPQELTIVDAGSPQSGHAQMIEGSNVRMYRPTLRPDGHAAPPPPAQPPPKRTMVSTQVLEKQRDEQVKQAMAAQQREEVELNREQAEELRQAKSTNLQQQIIERQAAEKKAFEERRAKENQRLQAQLQRQFAKAGADTTKVNHLPPKMLNVNHGK